MNGTQSTPAVLVFILVISWPDVMEVLDDHVYCRLMYLAIFSSYLKLLKAKSLNDLFSWNHNCLHWCVPFDEKTHLARFHAKSGNMPQRRIKTVTDCEAYGPDCIVSLKNLDIILQKFFRIFHILNNDFKHSQSSTSHGNERYYGTLLANINFLLEEKASNNIQSTVASSQLHDDLVDLAKYFSPHGNLALPDLISLLGYSEGFTSNHQTESVNDKRYDMAGKDNIKCNIDSLNEHWNYYLNKGN